MTHLPSFRPRSSAGSPGSARPVAAVTAVAADAGAEQAYRLLRTVFTVAPILFGLDKFAEVMTSWEKYLAPWINAIVPGTAHQAMLAVGVVEVVAGVLVAVRPDVGGYVVAAWLAGIIVDLLSLGRYYDVALRDFGLLVAALALARLAHGRFHGAGPISRGAR